MATQYTDILKLALPVTGELDGTWGDVVNDNITSMIEEAIAGLATISTWTANSHTLTVADGTTSESRCAILVLDDDGLGNPSAAATVICPSETKTYVVDNRCGQTATIKTAAGTGVDVLNGYIVSVFRDGTNVRLITSLVDAIKSSATNGLMQIVGPAAGTVRTATIPDANFTVARTDAGQTFTGVQVMTSPKVLTSINDTNGNEVVGLVSTASAVNEVSITNAATGGTPTITATGNDANIGLTISPKGSGTLNDNFGKLRGIPQAGAVKTTNYTLQGSDIGQVVVVGAGGSITIPNGVFTTGDAISIFNNSSALATINCSITTAYVSGTDVDRASVTLGIKGVATVLFINSSVCVITGTVI